MNLLLLRGNFGKLGAGICPVRGHSNVQGDRTMGVDEKPKPALLDQIKKAFGFEPPRAHGHNVVKAVQAMVDGRAKVFIGLGGNFVRAVPDWTVAEAAMRRLRLTVAVSTKLNRGHLVHGEEALILPALARSDIDIQAGGREVGHRRRQHVDGARIIRARRTAERASEVGGRHCLRHGKSHIARLRHRLGLLYRRLQPDPRQDRRGFPGPVCRFQRADPSAGRLSPDYSAASAGLEHGHGPRQFSGVSRGRRDCPVSDPAMLRLATLRSHDQYNTTIYSLDDRYRGVFGGRMVVFMNEADMQARGIAEGDEVEIELLAEDGKRRVVGGFWVKPYSIPVGSIGAYYPETNPLLPLAYHDLKSGTPAANSSEVLKFARSRRSSIQENDQS